MVLSAAPPRRTRVALLLALAMVLGACRGSGPSDRAEAPTVVAADGVLCDLTRVLAADDLRVACLIEPGTDPHTLSLGPAQARSLRQADLVLVHGLGLTPALANPPTDATVVAVAEEAALQPVPLDGDGHGHDHGEDDTAARSDLRERAQRAGGVLIDLDAWAARQIATISADRRVLATAHRAFATYARRYGLRELPLLDAYGGEGALRPAVLAGFAARLERENVTRLFPEQSPPSKALRTIARQSGIPLADTPLSADGLAPDRSTVGTFVDNTCTIVTGLGGSCDRRGAEKLERRWRAIAAG